MALFTCRLYCGTALLFALSSSAFGGEECRRVTGAAFAVCIPARAVLSTRDHAELDFLIHSLSGSGLPEITIYEGNHPEALPKPKGAQVGRVRIGSERALKHSYESMGAEIVFLRIRVSRKGWPQYIQLSLVNRTQEEAVAANKVLKTIHRLVVADRSIGGR